MIPGGNVSQDRDDIRTWSTHDERLPQTIDDGAFEVCHHLDIVVVLNVIARDRSDLPVNDHELAVERAKRWSMEVDDREVQVGNILRRGQANTSSLPCLWRDILVVVQDLPHRSA